jgi:membrane-associated phospholipid phosphatase
MRQRPSEGVAVSRHTVVAIDPGLAARLHHRLAVSGYLLVAFAVLTALAAGPLAPLDVALDSDRRIDSIRPVLLVVDRIGQRAVCLPVLVAVVIVLSRRTRSRRPAAVAALAVLAVNLLVGGLKLGLERGAPLNGEPGFLAGGVMYPSGHTANVVLVYGLAAYLWCRYTDAARRTRLLLAAVVAALTVVMTATSLTLRWHWFTDLAAGALVGAAVLVAVAAADCAVVVTVAQKSRKVSIWAPSALSRSARSS